MGTYTRYDFKNVFEKFSRNQRVTYDGLKAFISSLFTDHDSNSVEEISECLHTKGADGLKEDDFKLIWDNFVAKILNPVSAFVIVDVQNDFISGSLALSGCPAKEDGAEVVPVINKVLDSVPFNYVFYTYDWHPHNHISFHSNLSLYKDKLIVPSGEDWKSVGLFGNVKFDGKPPLEQTMWPDHCVQGSEGAKLHKDLKVKESAIFVYKGSNPAIDSYSAFWDNGEICSTGLLDELTKRDVTDVYVCGLATDICVNFTATHACKHHFRTILVEDACRGVDNTAIQETKSKLSEMGALIRSSDNIEQLVSGQEIPSKLGLVAAQNFRRKFLIK